MHRPVLFLTALLLGLAATVRAQVAVEVKAEKRVYTPGEPVFLRISATNGGKQDAVYTLPDDYLPALTILKLTEAGKPETLAQGQPPASGVARTLAPGESFVSDPFEITAKLSGEGAYMFAWKVADVRDAKMATCAVWKPEDLARLKDTVAVIETNLGKIVVEFLPELAPVAVQNFLNLARRGFYRKLTFHRIIEGFMMQGGCPAGNGVGKAGYTLAGEFSDVKHVRGVLSMAREPNPDSASCQFYICFGEAHWLDGGYTAFGKVLSGFDTLDLIEKVKTDHHALGGKCGKNHRDMPLDDVKILEVKTGPRAELAPAGEQGKGG